jgi:hypothetical protein
LEHSGPTSGTNESDDAETESQGLIESMKKVVCLIWNFAQERRQFLILTHVISGRTVLRSPAAFAVKPCDWPTSERTELWLPQPVNTFIPSINT